MFKALIVGLSLFLATTVFAEDRKVVETMVTEDSVATVGVSATATRYTNSFSLLNVTSSSIGVMYKATSDGTVTVTIRPQQSYKRPTTELASDDAYIDWDSSENISDESWHMMTLDTVNSAFGRFKLIGTGSNDASTYLEIKVIK